MRFFALLLSSALVALATAAGSDGIPETVELNPPVGRVRGSLMTSRLGKKIYSFRGIRFAEPPVGNLRFQPPVPAASWKDVFDATQEGPSCPQFNGELQSEDCLRLNVYTTRLPKAGEPTNRKRPVMIYFHPGAFYVFTGQSMMVGPQYIMDQDIVLVTVNNRLGTLGWVATGDALAPGNLGLKDQVVAMRWVQKNIAAFGGDPNSVTIAGYSAGGWSVSLHLVSPMTKGLFHRAISMSGSAINHTPLPTQQIDILKRQAQINGCPTNSSAAMLDCLRAKPALEIGDHLSEFFTWRDNPVLLWSPVVEPDVPGVERFLPAQPVDLIKQGKMHDVPYIIGNTKDEFASAIVAIVQETRRGGTVLQELNDNWDKYAPLIALYERDTERSHAISATFKRMYFNNQPITLENINGLANLYRDALSFQGHRLVNVVAQYSKRPVYYYNFAYQGRYTYGARWNDTNKPFGVSHHDDLLYLFYNPWFQFPFFQPNDPEIMMVERLTAMWGSFVKSGYPIPAGDPKFANVTWTPYTRQNKLYMENGNRLVMKRNYRGRSMSTWDRLFPIQTSTQTRIQSCCGQGPVSE